MSADDRRDHPSSLRTWLGLTALLASLIALAMGARLASMREVLSGIRLPADTGHQLMRHELQFGAAWLLAAPLIAWLGQRWSFGRVRWPLLLALHLALGTAIAAFVTACEPATEAVMVIGPGNDGSIASTPFGPELQAIVDRLTTDLRGRGSEVCASLWSFGTKVCAYLLLAAVAGGLTFRRHAIASERAAARTERELARSELRALRAQLQPHFLFNALNSVQVLLDDDLAGGRRMLQQLASLLRASLTCIDRAEVPLQHEIDVLRSYVAIEQIRFQDRIRFTIEVEPGLDGVMVPPFCLQPLVENALRHGPGALVRGGSISVCARRGGSGLILQVADDGPGSARGDVAGGFGVRNVRERLRRLYGDRARLDLANGAAGGFVATLHVPFAIASRVAVP